MAMNKRIKYRFIVGTNDAYFRPTLIDFALLKFFAGFTYYKGRGGWHTDGAPYAGGGNQLPLYEDAYIWEVVCQESFDKLDDVKKNISNVVSGYEIEAIMVEVSEVSTENFLVSEHRTLGKLPQ